MKKRFEVHKKFDINSTRSNEREGRWLKQPDATSCGYYLIHNANNYINIPSYEGNPNAVFEAVNRIRRQEDKESLPHDRNLPSNDLARYFTNRGLNVTQLSNPNYDAETINRTLNEKDFDLIYMSTHSHYTGIVQNQGQLLYLDSLTDGPRPINIDEARNCVLGSLGQESNGRYNCVGIVKKQHKKFKIL